MDPIDFNQSTSIPLLTLGSNNTEFDYAAYLQDEDLDYLGDTGSSGSASIMNDVASASVSPPTSVAVKGKSNQKPRLERNSAIVWALHKDRPQMRIPPRAPDYSSMHAILGLAASDLMIREPNLVTFAMAHRLKAIKAIKKTLTDVPKANAFEERNALLATCYALTFQSVMLDDGMAEFMTFCRGIVIVAIQMRCNGVNFIFHDFLGDDHIVNLQPLIEAVPLIRRDWIDMAVASIAALEPLCKQQVEIKYHQLITNLATYQMLFKHYGWWMQIPHEDFQSIINGENQVCLLLASHWIALKQIMATITEVEHAQRPQRPQGNDGEMDIGIVRWLKHVNKHIDMDHQQYNQWPLWVEAQLDIDLGYFGKELH
ncbi:hypothetical protein FHL15_006799 [Xylaria flabelliformis]|uniref:Transcription factor domain-containing protein n=1 Tax=Xylaria flabelliformis TaxID=2512241 RepID=A0A553HW47_9PEZI|nr:hypothetical protein FHL15_006799 [Xylaria flabelliformis]